MCPIFLGICAKEVVILHTHSELFTKDYVKVDHLFQIGNISSKPSPDFIAKQIESLVVWRKHGVDEDGAGEGTAVTGAHQVV